MRGVRLVGNLLEVDLKLLDPFDLSFADAPLLFILYDAGPIGFDSRTYLVFTILSGNRAEAVEAFVCCLYAILIPGMRLIRDSRSGSTSYILSAPCVRSPLLPITLHVTAVSTLSLGGIVFLLLFHSLKSSIVTSRFSSESVLSDSLVVNLRDID